MNTPGQNSNAVAELVIAMMIFMSRNQFNPSTGTEVMGKKLGIHGFGNIGRLVCEKAKGLGMQVFADPHYTPEKVRALGGEPVNSTEELYKNCDFVALHMPAKPETLKSIGYDLLMGMPKGACIINAARKEVIDEEGLAKAFEERQDLKYATDIMPDNYELLKEKFGNRVFATPKKMGAQTAEANINAGLAAARQIADFFATGNNKFQVNKW
jgi:D-3-phosphoglycerate dehydrogenase